MKSWRTDLEADLTQMERSLHHDDNVVPPLATAVASPVKGHMGDSCEVELLMKEL